MAALLIALTVGAIGSGLLVVHARDFAPLLPMCVSALVVVIAALYFPVSRHRPGMVAVEEARGGSLAA